MPLFRLTLTDWGSWKPVFKTRLQSRTTCPSPTLSFVGSCRHFRRRTAVLSRLQTEFRIWTVWSRKCRLSSISSKHGLAISIGAWERPRLRSGSLRGQKRNWKEQLPCCASRKPQIRLELRSWKLALRQGAIVYKISKKKGSVCRRLFSLRKSHVRSVNVN